MLDGQPIAAYSNAALHRHIALVGQEPVLFARSIRDNISYGCDEYGWSESELDRRLVEAAMQVLYVCACSQAPFMKTLKVGVF